MGADRAATADRNSANLLRIDMALTTFLSTTSTGESTVTTNKKTFRRSIALLAALALFAAACGDDSDQDTSESTTTTTTVAPSVPDENNPDPDVEDPEPDEPVELTATDTGVTESMIRIGVVFPDTSLLGRDPGDLEAKFRSIADAVNESGGINGRSIEMTFRAPNPLDDLAFDAICVELTQDVEVFAALGLFPRTSADCYASINDTIVVSTFGISADQRASYSAPGITIVPDPARLVDARIDALIEGGVLDPDVPVALAGGDVARAEHDLYLAALAEAGIDVVADTILLADGQDLLALEAEMRTFTEVWASSGAEMVVASTALLSQALLIAYNGSAIDLPMVLPEGTGVAPSFLQDQQGLDLTPFDLATALVEGDDQATKYETGADGVRECVDAFEASSGEDVALDESRNNLAPTVVACQVFDIFVTIATAAGAELTTEWFAAAAETFGPIDVTDLSSASLGPDKLDLNDSVGVVATYNAERVQFEPIS
jgi:hypothetical protein